MKISLVFLLISFALPLISQDVEQRSPNVIYKYKKYERFDLDEMSLEGETGSPGDLSIIPRFQKQFKNRLPYRTNFIQQIKRAVSSIR